MIGKLASRRSVVLAAVLAGLVLSGCASGTQSTGSGPMGGAGAGGSHSTGSGPMGGAGAGGSHSTASGMMGGGSAYHYSRSTCAGPKSLPGFTVSVTLADMGMTRMMGGTAPLGLHMMLHATPATEPAGKISLVASNMGWRTHELVILPLAAGASAGQRVPGPDGKVDETGSLGEASSSCAGGTGDGITAGKVGWTTVTLAPGRYELLCNLKNHYADGMHQELVVT